MLFSFGFYVPYSSPTICFQPKPIGIHNLIIVLNYLKSKKCYYLSKKLFYLNLN